MVSTWSKLILTFLVVLFSGCVSKKHLTYNDLQGPVYSKSVVDQSSLPKLTETLKVVSYNIEHSRQVDKAIDVLRNHQALKDADILCVQEMDLPGVKQIAAELGLSYVYYPSVRHAFTHKDFGNAILSRWPLSNSQKYILPAGRMTQMQRIMVGASVHYSAEREIRAYCLHDDVYLSAYTKRDMAQFVLENIDDEAEYVIVAGDFNTYSRLAQKSVENEFEKAHFAVSTPNVSWTSKHWYLFNKKCKLDEIFSQNMEVVDSGVITERVASDHRPIWTELRLENPKIASQSKKHHRSN